jgi:Domain of unknown function (DUF5615)
LLIRFLADASLNRDILGACLRTDSTIDFLSAKDAGLKGMPDPMVLATAADLDRILVTHDFKTMPRHFGEFVESGRRCPGVFLLSQRHPVRVAAEALVLMWATSEHSEWENRILKIPF